MRIQQFKYGIFDVDGTLIDSIPVKKDIFSNIAKESFGIEENLSREFFLSTSGMPVDLQFKSLLKQQKKTFSVSVLNGLKDKFYLQTIKNNYLIFPEVKETLKQLLEAKITLYASTGSDIVYADRVLKTNGILKLFKIVLAGDKNKEEHIKLFARDCRLPIKEFTKKTFFVGDTIYDMNVAKKFNIYAIGIINTFSVDELKQAGADRTVSIFKSLLNI